MKAERGAGLTDAEMATELAANFKGGVSDELADALVAGLGAARIAELVAVLTNENAINKPVLTMAYIAIAENDNITDAAKVRAMLTAGLDDEFAAVLAAELVTEPEPN